MNKNVKDELSVRFKIAVIEYAQVFGVTKACRELEVSRSTFYVWKNKYDYNGKSGLYQKKPIASTHPRKTSREVIDKIFKLRTEYKLGSLRIVYYLLKYHDIKISESTVSRILWKHKLTKLPKSTPKEQFIQSAILKKFPDTMSRLMLYS